MNKKHNKQLLQQAIKLQDTNEAQAIQIYKQLIAEDPEWSVPYYNLGLLYKYRGDWIKSLKYNELATKFDSSDQPAWWNMGIAATALQRWRDARTAWKGFGIPIEIDDEQININIGHTPIRLKHGEVIWAKRICPARAQLDNIPTDKGDYRYKDVILHDGAPNGIRNHNGHEFPVFDELQLLQKSDYKTYAIGAKAFAKDSIDQLSKLCDDADCGFENWTETLRMVCQKCSQGIPHEHHEHVVPKWEEVETYQLAIATQARGTLDEIVGKWVNKTGSEVLWVK